MGANTRFSQFTDRKYFRTEHDSTAILPLKSALCLRIRSQCCGITCRWCYDLQYPLQLPNGHRDLAYSATTRTSPVMQGKDYTALDRRMWLSAHKNQCRNGICLILCSPISGLDNTESNKIRVLDSHPQYHPTAHGHKEENCNQV